MGVDVELLSPYFRKFCRSVLKVVCKGSISDSIIYLKVYMVAWKCVEDMA